MLSYRPGVEIKYLQHAQLGHECLFIFPRLLSFFKNSTILAPDQKKSTCRGC
jgi:hypothetical protein